MRPVFSLYVQLLAGWAVVAHRRLRAADRAALAGGWVNRFRSEFKFSLPSYARELSQPVGRKKLTGCPTISPLGMCVLVIHVVLKIGI